MEPSILLFPSGRDVLEACCSAVLGPPFTVIVGSASLLSRVGADVTLYLGGAQPPVAS